MNTLIITAHPSSKWFTHKIAEAYKTWSEQKWNKVEILNLYTSEIKANFLEYEDISGMTHDSYVGKMHEKIAKAQEIIFVFPVWWYDSPAIMKNFIDVVFTSWFAYKYHKRWYPIWLLTEKYVKVFCTADGPSFIYTLWISPLQRMWKLRLGFCWMKIKTFKIFWLKRKATDEIQNKWLEEVRKYAEG